MRLFIEGGRVFEREGESENVKESTSECEGERVSDRELESCSATQVAVVLTCSLHLT